MFLLLLCRTKNKETQPFDLTEPACLTDAAPASYIHGVHLFHREQLLHGVHLLLADEVGDGYHRPLTPVLPLHHHAIAKQLKRGVLVDAVPLGDARYRGGS